MNKYKKRMLKKRIKENKNKLIISIAVIFVLALSVGYAAFNQTLSITGSATIKDALCAKNITGNFTITNSWQGNEIAKIDIDNYEQEVLENFTIEMKVPSGTTLAPMQQCVLNTVDGNLLPDANGIIIIELHGGENGNCSWISQIPAATNSNNTITPGSWGNGQGFSFTLKNDIIDSNNEITPDYIRFNGCTIYGEAGNQETPLTALGLSPSSETIGIGEVLNLTTSKTPSYKQVDLVYTSSNTNVATVSSTGVVTGVAPGTATITVSAEGISATSTITVIEQVIEVESITITPSTYRIEPEETVPLQVSFTPSNATSPITWTSSDPTVATVSSSGVVTGVSDGTATITATTDNNVTATSTITVASPLSHDDVSITFAQNYPYQYGDSYMFTLTIENLTSERITYFKIGLDIPQDVTFNLWQSNVRALGNYLEMISNDYTFIEANGTFTIQGNLTFPDSVLIDGQTPWGSPSRNIPEQYQTLIVTSIELE